MTGCPLCDRVKGDYYVVCLKGGVVRIRVSWLVMCDNWITVKNVTRRAISAGGFFVGVRMNE